MAEILFLCSQYIIDTLSAFSKNLFTFLKWQTIVDVLNTFSWYNTYSIYISKIAQIFYLHSSKLNRYFIQMILNLYYSLFRFIFSTFFLKKIKLYFFMLPFFIFSAFLLLFLLVFLWPKTGEWPVCNLLCHKCSHTWPMHSCISYLFYCCFCLFCCYFVLYSKLFPSLSFGCSQLCFFTFQLSCYWFFPFLFTC